MEHVGGGESRVESFEFRRMVSSLRTRFELALDTHHRNPDYRMFVVVHPENAGDVALARIRITSREVAETVLVAGEKTELYFDIGLPLATASTEAPILANLNKEGYFVYFDGLDVYERATVDETNFMSELPSEFRDLMKGEIVAVPLIQRPLTQY